MKAFRITAHLISLCVALQAAWIALAFFTLESDKDDGVVIDKSYGDTFGQSVHSVFAIVIAVLGIVMLVMAFTVTASRARAFGLALFGVIVLQWVLAAVSFAVPAIGILHGLNALVVIGLAENAARRVGATGSSGMTDAVSPAVA